MLAKLGAARRAEVATWVATTLAETRGRARAEADRPMAGALSQP
jgi:hypothetical protein